MPAELASAAAEAAANELATANAAELRALLYGLIGEPVPEKHAHTELFVTGHYYRDVIEINRDGVARLLAALKSPTVMLAEGSPEDFEHLREALKRQPPGTLRVIEGGK